MKKLTLTLALVGITIAVAAALLFLPTHTTLGKEVLSKPIAEEFKLVGYRSLSTDPATTGQIHYFVVGLDANVDELTPFLITTDRFVRVSAVEENSFHLTINGKISAYHNDLWVKRSNGTVKHWRVSADANYQR
ncbi:hypothetical protein HGP28_03165 [Vibrio sp. SM6]|uniref:Uncharacterized protein n=1 Tax=Vibrio agarilyticus TaxID=2726741 RepID=A0A7X8YG00_9VIBR|nr:hypothetical protein [Vibrio agarilyticus]NLS11891.1 hypothetical protein [Vibrio agarilyticus]